MTAGQMRDDSGRFIRDDDLPLRPAFPGFKPMRADGTIRHTEGRCIAWGCHRKARARGLCDRHYRAFRRAR